MAVDEAGEVTKMARVLDAIAVTIKLVQYLRNLASDLVSAGYGTAEQGWIKRRPALSTGHPVLRKSAVASAVEDVTITDIP